MLASILLSLFLAPTDELAALREALERLTSGDPDAAAELLEHVDELGEKAHAEGLTAAERRAWLEGAEALATHGPCPRPAAHHRCVDLAARAALAVGDDLRTTYWACAAADLAIAEGRLEDALDACDRALDRAPDEPLYGGPLRASRADALRRLERFDAAESEIDEARRRLVDSPFHDEVRVQLHGLEGLIDAQLGRPYEAALAFEREEATLDALDPARHDPRSLAQLRFAATTHAANLDLALERFELAERRLSRFLGESALARSGPVRAQVQVMLGLARSEAARDRTAPGALGEARDALLEALPEAPPEFALTAHNALADLALRAESWSAAAEHLTAAKRLLERVRKPTERALWAAHAARHALGCDASQDELAARLEELDDAWQRTRAEWLRLPPSPEGIGFLHVGTQRLVLSERIRLHLALDPSAAGRARALDVLIEAQGLGVVARSVGGGALRLADVRSELFGEREGALVWFPAMDRSHLFAVDRERVEHVPLPSRDVLVELVRAHRDVVTEPPRGVDPGRRERDLERSGSALAAALLPAAARELLERCNTVHLVGLELIRDPALEALSVGPAPLGTTHALVRTASLPLSVAQARRAREAPVSRAPILVGLPTLGPTARALAADASALDEGPIDSLLDAVRDRAGPVVTGSDATLRALRSTAGASPLIVLAHGAFLDDSGGRPALLLAADDAHDGIVDRDDLERIQAPPLVVLLACGSARGPERLGDDGIASITGALQVAGARTVIASREDLPRDATYRLAARLVEHLGAHVPAAEALRRARAELARSQDFGDPWFWGLLHAEGLGR